MVVTFGYLGTFLVSAPYDAALVGILLALFALTTAIFFRLSKRVTDAQRPCPPQSPDLTLSDRLPPDIWMLVIQRLDLTSKQVLRFVSKEFASLVRAHDPHTTRKLQVSELCQNLEMVRWGCSVGCPLDARTCAAAARAGNLSVLRWLRDSGCPWDSRTCSAAAEREENSSLLWWAREQGCDWDASVSSQAAARGDLNLLKEVVSRGCPVDESVSDAASEGGQQEVLIWLHESCKCPWGPATCKWAAWRGDLETLMWAWSRGCPCDEDTCTAAAAKGHLQVIYVVLLSRFFKSAL
mmetsp:Transcript_8201/g.19648  ORF Transcript_8201/g.19648 Transcript_8201/m.19648 type:complete len:295 (-) Transcript_8201:1302-2186(-)